MDQPLTVLAFVEVLRTADALTQAVAAVLKPSGLSHPQYNVLRILRGAGPEGLPCGQIAGRMLTHDPDMTRLLDRLEARGLVSRTRPPGDRRIVTARITDAGLAALAALDEPVRKLHQAQFGGWSDAQLRTFLNLLRAARESAAGRPA